MMDAHFLRQLKGRVMLQLDSLSNMFYEAGRQDVIVIFRAASYSAQLA